MAIKKFNFFNRLNISTFAELLDSVNRIIVSNVQREQSFRDFNSLSIGVDEYSTQYPYLMIIPVQEEILRFYTTSFADVSRTLKFVVRTIKPTQDASFGQANGLLNNLKNFFKRKRNNNLWQLSKLSTGDRIVFNTEVSDIKFVDYQKTNLGVISEASMNVSFFCQIATDSIKRIDSAELKETNLKEMTKIIHELIGRYKSTLLPEIKKLKYGTVEPISHFPAVAIIPENAEITSRFVGTDSYDSSYIIFVFTDFLNAPKSIFENLDIIHKIREIMFANRFLFNRSYDTEMNSIVIGTSVLENVGYFTSQLTINCSSFEPYLE